MLRKIAVFMIAALWSCASVAQINNGASIGNPGLSNGGGSSAAVCSAVNFATNFNSLSPPALPSTFYPVTGTFVSSNDGTNNSLSTTSTGATETMWLSPSNVLTSGATTNFTFTVAFENTANPTTSYIFPGFNTAPNGGEYEVVLSRGTGEARGALWVQKNNFPSPSVTLGSPTYLGTSGTTFTGGNKYTVTAALSGNPNRTIAVSVQRAADSLWLTSAATWSATQQVAISYTDSSTPASVFGGATLNINSNVSQDSSLYSVSFDHEQQTQFTRFQTTPVLALGSSYGGWTAAALAAPAATSDGSRYVMTVSMWQTSNSQWASAFFTSSNMQSWAYVTGSLLTPSGSDYIFGNSGLVWFNSAYWMAYSHYPSAGTPEVSIQKTTDTNFAPGNWASVSDPLVSNVFDPSLDINPINNKLELWYGTNPSGSRTIHMKDSPDGVTWTDEGDFLSPQSGFLQNLGEPSVFYINNVRYMTFDSANQNGYRNTLMAHSPGNNTTWVIDGIVIGPDKANSWEITQVFDTSVIVADLSDGKGNVPRALYAGTVAVTSTDNTQSSLGLASLLNICAP